RTDHQEVADLAERQRDLSDLAAAPFGDDHERVAALADRRSLGLPPRGPCRGRFGRHSGQTSSTRATIVVMLSSPPRSHAIWIRRRTDSCGPYSRTASPISV